MTGRLRVLFVTSWYPTKDQPVAGVFVREHAKAVQLYDDVTVLHLAGWDPNLASCWHLERETDRNLTEGIPSYRVLYRRSPVPNTSYVMYLWSCIRAFRYLVGEVGRPDIIHAHIYTAGVPAGLIGRLHGIPMVITEHTSGFPRKTIEGLDAWKARLAFRWADVVMPVSVFLRRAIEELRVRARFEVIPNVVDTSLFHPSCSSRLGTHPTRLLFVGLLSDSHIKGVPYLLKALAQLKEQHSDWHLDIVGDGPARVGYEDLVADLGLTDKVTFHGLKSKREVAEFMRKADIFVLSSLLENLPCVLIEAQATGLPIIATHVGGIPEIVDEETGILVPPGDADSLAKAIALLLQFVDDFDRQAIAHKALRYSYSSVGQRIHRVYSQCV